MFTKWWVVPTYMPTAAYEMTFPQPRIFQIFQEDTQKMVSHSCFCYGYHKSGHHFSVYCSLVLLL